MTVKAIGWVTDCHVADGAIVPTLSVATVESAATDAGIEGPAIAADGDSAGATAVLVQFVRDYAETRMGVAFEEGDGIRLVRGIELVP